MPAPGSVTAILRIRGTDLTRINVTINGIPLNDSESHGVWWVDLPDFASSAESIQIQRGVGTSTNGAAAFGASINIRSDDPEVTPYGEASISGGSFKTFKLTSKAGTGLIKKRWALDDRFSLIYSGGYIDRASADLFSFTVSGGYFGKNSIVRLMVLSGNERNIPGMGRSARLHPRYKPDFQSAWCISPIIQAI